MKKQKLVLRWLLGTLGGGVAGASVLLQGFPGWLGIAGAFLAGVMKHVPNALNERQ